MPLEIPNEYGLVLFACGLIGVVQWGTGAVAMQSRKYFANAEFLSKPAVQLMNEQHKKAFGSAINKDGYPDMGSGLYAKELDYCEWVHFNNAQRAHYNLVEVSGPALACCITGGLYQPVLCGGLGTAFAVARIMYTMGYKSSGASGRMAGALIGALSIFGLFGVNLYYGGMAVKGFAGL